MTGNRSVVRCKFHRKNIRLRDHTSARQMYLAFHISNSRAYIEKRFTSKINNRYPSLSMNVARCKKMKKNYDPVDDGNGMYKKRRF